MADPTNEQFVVQPYPPTANLQRITQGSSSAGHALVHLDGDRCVVLGSRGVTVGVDYTGPDTPPNGAALADIELLAQQRPRTHVRTRAQVIIQSFTFTPA